MLRQQRRGERRRRHLDHGADRDLSANGVALGAQLARGGGDELLRLAELLHAGDHREHDLHGAVGRGAQQRAQLACGTAPVLQAQADGAQAQRRVVRRRRPAAAGVDLLVGAQIQGADGDRRRSPSATTARVGLVLLLLAGQVLPVHVEELGAVQAHALGAQLGGVGGVLGQLDVGEQADLDAVARYRRACRAAATARRDRPCWRARLAWKKSSARASGSARAWPRSPSTMINSPSRSRRRAACRPTMAGNAEAARQDRGVRQRAAVFGDEAGDALLRQQDDVCGRDVVGHDHQGFPACFRRGSHAARR